VDAPCTGYGIIRRKPDIKWSRDSIDKLEILKLQEKILETSSRYVKPNGVLVYSTCTIEPEENEEIIKKFIDKNNEFMCENISSHLPSELIKDSAKDGYVQFYPNIEGIDGFFIARMKRRC
ncbi:MAG: 16S rRNA (cytosine(967)-C(5))-methyltransferase RsmB, partial [Clostridiaceae bacterium]|nr:16S rRNA (cytosine(967)-C(5))-methyltransferase RsmB [Clostridiaceae bacterium]